MKKRYINIIAVCMAALVVAACGKEQIQQPVPDPEPGNEPEVVTEALDKLTVQAEVATKTVLDGNSVKWSVGDAISVFSTAPGGVNRKFKSSHSEESLFTTFSGEVESGTTEVVAVYPYTDGAKYLDGTITGFSIPTQQTATESSFANGASVTFAKAPKTPGDKTLTMTFQNLCSVLKFTVPEGIKQNSSIRVESINTAVKMSGAATIDIATSDITASESSVSYVELTGNFTGGKTYCVTVAPGDYDQGFRFTLTGTNDTPLVRKAPAVKASKNKVYNIGALNPEPAEDAASISSCSIDHTYDEENSTLTGSVATITLAASVPNNEFAGNIKGWKVKNVTMEDQNATVYRTLVDTVFTNGQSITLNAVSDKPYIPHGDYTISADIYYTVKKADGSDADKKLKTVTTTVTSLAPDAGRFTLDAYVSGYTSYNYGTGTDKTKDVNYANNLSPTRIYEIDATYKRGLSAGVDAQCHSLLSVVPTLDGSTFTYDAADGKGSGNQKGGQSWAPHTLGAKLSFDGSAQQTCATTRTVHITGLPYTMPSSNANTGAHPWGRSDKGTFDWSNGISLKPAYNQPQVNSPEFYVPSGNINIVSTGSWYTEANQERTIGIRVGGGSDNPTLKKWAISKKTKPMPYTFTYGPDNWVFTTSAKKFEIEYFEWDGTVKPMVLRTFWTGYR